MRLAALILAAGQSSRFGGCKQLAILGDSPLLQHSIDAAGALGGPVYVIGGRWQRELELAFARGSLKGARLIHSPDWQQGMGHSIASGVSQLEDHYDGILIMLSDQVALKAAAISSIAQQFSGENIVCSYYQARRGAPALFGRNAYAELCRLQGDKGARSLLNDPTRHIQVIDMPDAAIDIDTPQELAAFAATGLM
ncbi:nucleotidyltransferase family protein [Marinobacterium jannaschii]|uniref:nucleotidyltransferase family protein n=1 Tax=Marinobacterium jannaschii TaxID=64970 RepID=UPI000486EEF5|nr:nucleotidyltransferase family protein [Marinobacterium jannaschii]